MQNHAKQNQWVKPDMTAKTAERMDCINAIAELETALEAAVRLCAERPRQAKMYGRLDRLAVKARQSLAGAREVLAHGGHVPSETVALRRALAALEKLSADLESDAYVCRRPSKAAVLRATCMRHEIANH